MASKHTLEQIINVSKDLMRISSLNDAFLEIRPDKLMIKSWWAQLDVEKNEKLRFQKNHLFETNSSSKSHKAKHLYTSQAEPLRNDVWNVKSPEGEKNAIVLNWKDSAEEKQFLEIWENGNRVQNINLTKIEKHGKIYERSALLGSFGWSSDSKKIAYVAEVKNLAKEKCLFNAKVGSSTDNKDALNEDNYEQKIAQFSVDDWGEQYVGKSESTIAIFDLETKEIRILDNLPKDYAPSQLSWNSYKGFVFNAFYIKPYRLGLVYCPIRRSELFYYDLDQNECIQLTNFNDQSMRCPNFSNNYKSICWLQNQAGGPHFQCSKLMIMNWETREITTLVDIVREYPQKDEDFPGIFAYNLPYSSSWSLDDKRILVNTKWRHTNRLISIDVETRKITNLDKNLDIMDSCNILKFENDWICAIRQAYNRRPSLMIAKLPEREFEADIEWIFTEKDDELLSSRSTVELIKFTPKIPSSKYPHVNYEATLVLAKNRNDTLIVFPHGGPHSSFACDFSIYNSIFYTLGFSILHLNFRGSSGYGQDSIESLPGNIGVNDVNDCQQAAEHISLKYGFKNSVLFGGSHGGFLTTQLVGQFPDFYAAAVARNPVTHIPSMFGLTDVPDWCVYEGKGKLNPYDHKLTGTVELLTQLYDKSPIKHIDNVKTPVMFLIGLADLRVPPSQGIQYHKALLARNVPTKLVTYKDDNHPLDKPQTTADGVIHSVLWFEKYTK